jgi:hypothetical protein
MEDQSMSDTLRKLAEKWREEANGVTAMGYSQQGDRIRDCAGELLAALDSPQAGETRAARCPSCGDSKQERIAGLWLCQKCGHAWDASPSSVRPDSKLLEIAGLVNAYHNDGTTRSAAETLRAIADVLGPPMEARVRPDPPQETEWTHCEDCITLKGCRMAQACWNDGTREAALRAHSPQKGQ